MQGRGDNGEYIAHNITTVIGSIYRQTPLLLQMQLIINGTLNWLT